MENKDKKQKLEKKMNDINSSKNSTKHNKNFFTYFKDKNL